MILAAFMLGISSLVISALAYINTNMLDEKFNNMIDHFDSIETQWRYDREIIFGNLKFLSVEIKKPKKDKKRQIVKKGKKNEKRRTNKRNLQRKNR